MMWGWGYGPGGGAAGWFAPILMLVFWALVIGGIVFLLRSWWPQGMRGRSGDTALEILRERYARGELSREQFEEMRRDLGAR